MSKGKFNDGKGETDEFGGSQPLECILHKTWVIPITQGMPKRNKAVSQTAFGNKCETANIRVWILKLGNKKTRNMSSEKGERDTSDSTTVWQQMRAAETHMDRGGVL